MVSWTHPNAVVERVFDEYDIEGCEVTREPKAPV
jgi:hypothetical protein